MDAFTYQHGSLHCEDVPVEAIVDAVGSPAYIYSANTLRRHYRGIADAFAELQPQICFSVKTCGNVHILALLAELGASFDIVSGGELHRVQQAGADVSRVVYAGVGKTDAEIVAALDAGIGWFNVESEAEFENIARLARERGVVTRAALRVNPNVADPKTHAKTTTGKRETKFGVDLDRARRFFETYGSDQACQLRGVHLHIGSPIYSPQPYVQAIERALPLIDELRAGGRTVEALNIGGGFAADYETGQAPSYADYAEVIVPLVRGRDLQLLMEPGRTIAANAGVLVTRVLYVKTGGAKRFVIVDSGENHLIRPAMYDAFHFIWPVQVQDEHVPPERRMQMDLPGLVSCDVVGPICETGDYFARDRALPAVERGDLLCVFSAGAYGMAMASNYNAFPRPPEVLVDRDRARLVRERESYQDLTALETGAPRLALGPVGEVSAAAAEVDKPFARR